MGKINLDHFLVTNATPGQATGGKTGLRSVRYFVFEKPQSEASFFGFIIFPTNFTGIGLLDKLISDLKKKFEAEPAFDEIIFEGLISFFNEKINLATQGHTNKKDLEKFDICLGALLGQKLLFAPLGNISAILFLPEAGRSRYYNLIKDAAGVHEVEETLKLKEIIAGNLTKNNTLIIANQELLDHLAFRDIEPLITVNEAHTSAVNLQKYLMEAKINGTFTGFIIETLESSVAARLKQTPAPFAALFKKPEEKKPRATHAERAIKKTNLTLEVMLSSAKTVWPKFIGLIKRSGKFILILFFALTNLDGRARAHWDEIIAVVIQNKNRLTAAVRAWPLPKKIFITAAAALVIILSIGVTRVSLRNNALSDEQRFNEKITIVENERTEAESAFLFGDKDRARTTLEKASADLKNIKPVGLDQSKALEKLHTQINERLLALWKIKNIGPPPLATDLKKITAVPLLIGATAIDDQTVVAWNAKTIFLIQAGTLSESWSTDQELENEYSYENGTLSIKTKSAGLLLQVSIPDKKINTAQIDGWKGKLTALTIKNGKLYALSNENLFITKHAPSLTGFAKGSGWLREAVEVKNSVTLAIDGNLYLSDGRGEIKKLYNGRLTDFHEDKISPSLSAVTKLWTSEDSHYLYLLDQPSKRVIIFDKKGSLVLQLQFNSLSALKDFYPINNKILMVFDGEKMYKIALDQYL